MTQQYEDMAYGDPIVESLVCFIADANFQQEFESFFISNCRTFDGEEEEHSLEYYSIYQDFSAMFEVSVYVCVGGGCSIRA